MAFGREIEMEFERVKVSPEMVGIASGSVTVLAFMLALFVLIWNLGQSMSDLRTGHERSAHGAERRYRASQRAHGACRRLARRLYREISDRGRSRGSRMIWSDESPAFGAERFY